MRQSRAADTGQAIEKIVHTRVLVSIAGEICIHALLKPRFAHPAFEHANYGRAFSVRDSVKGVQNVIFGGYGLANPAGGNEAIIAHRCEFSVEISQTSFP